MWGIIKEKIIIVKFLRKSNSSVVVRALQIPKINQATTINKQKVVVLQGKRWSSSIIDDHEGKIEQAKIFPTWKKQWALRLLQ